MLRSVMVVLAMALSVAACGGDNGPTGPTGQDVVDVAGVWNYTSRLTNATGGECVGQLFQAVLGAVTTGTMSITQNGASLTATSRSNDDGSACNYTGTAGRNSLALGWTACDQANLFGVQCFTGAFRDAYMQSNSINATISGRSASGTTAESYNIVVSGSGAGVGLLSITGQFTATR